MLTFRKFVLVTLLSLLGVSFTCAAPSFKPVSHRGKSYVTLDSIKTFYNFSSLKNTNGKLILAGNGTEIRFTPGGQEVFMNNVKFIFSEPVVNSSNGYLVSRIDLVKLIDPVLRPSYIQEAKPFDTVIIDPGHGGKDPGAVNSYGTEAGYNLAVAKLLAAHLKKAGFKVAMTRTDDRFLSLQDRVRYANKYPNAIFVSIHFNSGSRRARGIETFTLSPVGVAHYGSNLKSSDYTTKIGNQQDSANVALATALHWGSLSRLKSVGIVMPDRGIRRARFSVLTGIKHPAILIEGGFMSHPVEAKIIHSEKFQQTFALSLAHSIVFYRKATSPRVTASNR